MGKNIISQHRGRGGPRYRSPSHRYIGKITHRIYDLKEKTDVVSGRVINIIHDPGHSAPLAIIQYNNGEKNYMLAPEGINTNKTLESGIKATPDLGNTLPLINIPIGTQICNIEQNPGDGGKYIRAAGCSAVIVAKTEDKVTIQFPSKKLKELNGMCRATIGILAASGKGDKPFVKAGKRHHAMKSRNRLYPRTSAVAMNAVDHPFGSGRGRHIGKPKTPSKFAPPGAKVGLIGAKRTGRKK
ncbi:50S ribosomal protein L2 [Candidatus Woesearchaeota archaeon]|nr:50S ribosomal protein L2 [Candidatus Woesearchaeota archaeon]